MIGLVACSASKLASAAPARQLYQGALFKKQVAWLEARGHRWAILSAKHGLVQPEQVIEPYDQTLSEMSAAARALWSTRTNMQLKATFPGQIFLVLAGKLYRSAVRDLPFQAPANGLTIGRQLAFFGGGKA